MVTGDDAVETDYLRMFVFAADRWGIDLVLDYYRWLGAHPARLDELELLYRLSYPDR